METELTTKISQADQIIKQARFGRKHDYREYEYFKMQLENLALPYSLYESYTHKLIKVLEV